MNGATKDQHVQKVRYEPSKVKVMLMVAYDSEGFFISHAVPAGQHTTNISLNTTCVQLRGANVHIS
jgi:hypothetical protein